MNLKASSKSGISEDRRGTSLPTIVKEPAKIVEPWDIIRNSALSVLVKLELALPIKALLPMILSKKLEIHGR